VEQEIQNHHTQMINEAYMSHENKEKLKQLTSEPAMEEMFRTTSLKLENDVPLIPESVEAETVTLLDEFFSLLPVEQTFLFFVLILLNVVKKIHRVV
ncbi:hypothetical protein ACT453_41295, partial [Bacillus sp. D-CC]